MTDKKEKKNAPVQIAAALHAAVKRIAETRSLAEGRKVSIGDVLDAAARVAYPAFFATDSAVQVALPIEPATPASERMSQSDNADRPGAVGLADDIEPSEELFAQLVTAAFVAEGNRAVEQLFGSVGGSFGQRIKIKDLAYHLRSTTAPVTSLAELIADYEAGGAAALEQESKQNAAQ